MAKPTGTDTNVTWGESAYASVLEPSGAKQGILFQGDERPAAQYFNWFLRTLSRWIRYLNDFESLGHYWDALQIFRGAAGDDNSAMTVQPASITTRKLVFEMGGGAAGRKVRFYRVGATGVWEATFNAYWSASDSRWHADVSVIGSRGDSAKISLDASGFSIWRPIPPGNNSWVDADWEKLSFGPDDAIWSVIDPTTGSSGSNPACTVGAKNQLKAANIPKAWATIVITSGTASVEDGFNVASVSQATGTLTVNFPTGGEMADTNYSVLALSLGALTAPKWGCYARRTGGLDLISPDADITTGTHRVSVLVFGKQS